MSLPPDQIAEAQDSNDNEAVDWNLLIDGILKGIPQAIGLGLVALVLAGSAYFILSPALSVSTSARVVFAFNGLEKGEYPDHSKFQPDDLRAPDLILRALKLQGIAISDENQSAIRGAISIEGVIPTNILKERDRLRAIGQTPPLYTPDEYVVTLTLPRYFPLNTRQRELLLNELVSAYSRNFQQTYVDLPPNFGDAFETLRNTDFYEYELVLTQDVQSMTSYLQQEIGRAPTFRSKTTHLSFADLLQETVLFSKIHLNEALGLIYLNGLSKDRGMAMMKMDYYLRTLTDEENKALEQEKVVNDLLAQSQERSEQYVLGIKTQVAENHAQAPVLDQGLIDSLLANDAYNFLVRRALDAGLRVKDIQAEKARLSERRERMETFLKGETADQANLLKKVQESLTGLRSAYTELTANVNATNMDFAQQQYANAIRFGSGISTGGRFIPFCYSCVLGSVLGFLLGIGLSILGFHFGSGRQRP